MSKVEPAFRALEEIVAPRGDGTYFVLARPGEFLTAAQAELAGVAPEPEVRTAIPPAEVRRTVVEAPRAPARRRR